MSKETNVVYVGYDEAQRLIPVFAYYAKQGPWKEVRADASSILRELRGVRKMDYTPLSGQQIFLTEEQFDFFVDAREQAE